MISILIILALLPSLPTWRGEDLDLLLHHHLHRVHHHRQHHHHNFSENLVAMISILIILVLLPSFLLGEERTLEKFPSCLFNRCVASNCLTSFVSPIEYPYQIYVFAFTREVARRSYNFSMFTFIIFFVSLLSACLSSKEVGVLYLTVVRTNSMYLYAYMYLYRYQLFVFV